jgi:hypothetical protein
MEYDSAFVWVIEVNRNAAVEPAELAFRTWIADCVDRKRNMGAGTINLLSPPTLLAYEPA